MSRIPTFPLEPAERNRAVQQINPNGSYPTTRPLQIARPPSRPSVPGNDTVASSPKGSGFSSSPKGPFRPQRSELRLRQASEHSERASTSSRATQPEDCARDRRDSSSTTRSDASVTPQHLNGNTGSATIRPRVDPSRSVTYDEPSPATPALATVMAAFREAGARKRSMTNSSEDAAYEQEKQREKEKEMLRLQRIRERMPNRKATGKAKAGDIDGEQFNLIVTSLLHWF